MTNPSGWKHRMKFIIVVLTFPTIMILCWNTKADESHLRKSVLPPCPKSPNCVSSIASSAYKKMDPIKYQSSALDAKRKLLEITRSFKRATIVQNQGDYVKVQFRSRIFSFTDDVEFEFDDHSKIINFRSASRSGYYDLGVNRNRMETISAKFLLH